MTTVTLEEAQANLAGLIAELKPGEEILITEEDRPVARLVAEAPNARKPKTVPVKPHKRSTPSTPAHKGPPRQPGSAIGKLTIVEDDDSHLDDFREYMQ